MSRKRRKSKRHDPVQQIRSAPDERLGERLTDRVQRGRHREAIELAKELRRRGHAGNYDPLIRQAYLGRARQLAEHGLFEEAVGVCDNAAEAGFVAPEMLELCLNWGHRCGRPEPARKLLRILGPSLAEGEAQRLAAESLVLGGTASELPADDRLRDDAARVRRAFAAYADGDLAAARESLSAVGRRSPCAGWRLVLQGLLAVEAADTDAALAQWRRVDGRGACRRLARALAACHDGGGTDRDDASLVAALNAHRRDPRVTGLEAVKAALENHDGPTVLSSLERLIRGWPGGMPAPLRERLGHVVAYEGGGAVVTQGKELAALFGRTPPEFFSFRILALAAEGKDPALACDCWCRAIEQLDPLGLSAADRVRAEAMIWVRVGDIRDRIEQGEGPGGLDLCNCPECRAERQRRRQDDVPDSVSAYRRSLALCPDDRDVHGKLVDALQRRGDNREAEKAAEEQLRHWPDHVPGLLRVGHACLERKAYRKALKHFRRVRELEPLNREAAQPIQTCLLYSARRRWESGRPDLARQDFQEAVCVDLDGADMVYPKWAALEYAAGDDARGEALYARAVAAAVSPLLVEFRMVVELGRAGASARHRKPFQRRRDDLARPGIDATDLAEMATTLDAHIATRALYPTFSADRRWLVARLRQAKGARFDEGQFMKIASFLAGAGQDALAVTFLSRAARAFPDSYEVLVQLATIETQEGRRTMSRRTVRLLFDAARRAERRGDEHTARRIEMLLRLGRPMGEFGMLAALAEMMGMNATEDGELEADFGPEIEFGDDDGEAEPIRLPPFFDRSRRPRPRRRGRRPKRRSTAPSVPDDHPRLFE